MIVHRRKLVLLITLLYFELSCIDSKCVSVPQTFFDANITLCNKQSFCQQRIVDGCLEGRGFSRVYVNSQVKIIRKGAFKNLKNVETITVVSANVSDVEPGAFLGTNSLISLFLDENNLQVIHASTFSKLPIGYLLLSRNKITQIEDDAFADMNNLSVLDLSNNYLDRIKSNWFSRTTNIFRLVLSNNELTTLDINVFSQITKLELLELGRNKIHTINGKLSRNVKLVLLQLTRNHLTDVSFLIGTGIEGLDVSYNNISVGDDFARAMGRSMIGKVALKPNPWLCACVRRIENLMLKYDVELIQLALVREDSPHNDVPLCVELKIRQTFCDRVTAEDVEEARSEYFKSYRYD